MNKVNAPQPRTKYTTKTALALVAQFRGTVGKLQQRKAECLNQFKRMIKEVINAIILNTTSKENSFYFMWARVR